MTREITDQITTQEIVKKLPDIEKVDWCHKDEQFLIVESTGKRISYKSLCVHACGICEHVMNDHCVVRSCKKCYIELCHICEKLMMEKYGTFVREKDDFQKSRSYSAKCDRCAIMLAPNKNIVAKIL